MSEFASVEKLARAVNAALKDRSKSFDVRATGGKKPRFELYHSPISLCSQKVRTVLAEKNAPFTSHEVEILESNHFAGVRSALLRQTDRQV